jgi:hypothetical protein
LKTPSKFDFRLGFSDFDKVFFAMSSKYGTVFMVFFFRYISFTLKSNSTQAYRITLNVH